MGTQTAAPTPGTDAAHSADRRAALWLYAATGTAAALGIVWQLAGAGGLPFVPQNQAGSLLVAFGAGILAAALLLAAWFLTARAEERLGIRQQRGALAALAGLGVFCIPFTPALVFSPVPGLALILLSVRTRDLRTAAMGGTALAAALVLAFFPALPFAAPILALVAAAAFAVVVQAGSRHGRGGAGYSPRKTG
ncbi:hypothetical protein MUK71_02085 [Arthrobacter zhangbolii]|uniref:Tripartite tricarboxylate transporter TctB family protein n=1 Tax=Arthrobacter zhangbolii TaxID=2886936 RepID=A0A9X1M9Z6_9MICC|nr:hypothetical protein [Arthrobacter zhangbolii]MCC3273662.1 hypothetical protein [Arthrobacter zhangbolii]UON92467.1 hypothetical protein MUK71_02085 [Arthrobacter zhangbolii]